MGGLDNHMNICEENKTQKKWLLYEQEYDTLEEIQKKWNTDSKTANNWVVKRFFKKIERILSLIIIIWCPIMLIRIWGIITIFQILGYIFGIQRTLDRDKLSTVGWWLGIILFAFLYVAGIYDFWWN